MTETAKRIMLIGLDAADGSLLLEGCEAGWLPNLRALREEGSWGVAEAPPGFGSGAIWPSFYTGVTPARHGRYFYRQVFPGDYEASRFQAEDFDAPAVWDRFSDAGRRVAVFDVPKASLSTELRGLHAVDWLVHGPVYKELRTWPPGLHGELSERYVDPEPQCDRPGGRDARAQKAFLDTCIERVEQKEKATIHYWRQEPWDLFISVFGDPHCVGHQSWHVRDPSHPLHDAEAHALLGDPLKTLYEAIDASIGRIMAEAGEDTLVVVFSGTGMGPNYTGNYILDDVLRQLEGRRKTVSLDLLVRAKKAAKRVMPVRLRRRWQRTSRAVEERVRHADREQRRCFTVPHNDIAGAVRVNLQGREPHGTVRPEDVDDLFRSLRQELLALRNLETGGPVVEDVVRVADHCKGDDLERMPDFFVLWRRDAPIERVGSSKVREVCYRHRGNRTGDHVSDSLFFAKGPGVVPGRHDPVSIMDFAPTFAAIRGVARFESDGVLIPALGVPAAREGGE